MPEQQNIEFKSSWHDDYLKWIAGFANANGGKIYIGIDDAEKIVGISDYKKLMEEIPNKVKDLMGVIIDVNLLESKELYYLEIITHPYAVPISLRGRYYYRSGSTKLELTGMALTEFLLRKSGKTWDEVIEPSATLADIDEASIKTFSLAAVNSGRIGDISDLTTTDLLNNLRLIDDYGKLKRAAIILFGDNPGKFYTNCVVKIGRFGKDASNLKFQETIEGNIIHLLKEVPAQLNHKFLVSPIEFEGLQRIEKGEYPVAAVREMLLNALVHKNYLGTTIQISVYDNYLSIWNEGSLPEGMSLDSLKRQHPSRPRNPLIADVCFKGGFIDAWGRGTLKIINSSKEAGLPEPEIIEQDGGIRVTLFKDRNNEETLKKMGLNDRQIKAVQYVLEHTNITNAKYQELNAVGKTLATEELQDLVSKDVLKQIGSKGRGSKYEIK